jgi:hypothetical protein
MDVRDRVPSQRPFPVAQTSIRERPHLHEVIGLHPARRMQRRGYEGHPGDCPRLDFWIVLRQQRCRWKSFGEIVQDRSDLGQPAAIDQQRGDLAFWIDSQILGLL